MSDAGAKAKPAAQGIDAWAAQGIAEAAAAATAAESAAGGAGGGGGSGDDESDAAMAAASAETGGGEFDFGAALDRIESVGIDFSAMAAKVTYAARLLLKSRFAPLLPCSLLSPLSYFVFVKYGPP